MSPSTQKWLIISHAFNMDGRAASQTITDKIPFLIEAGIEPTVLSAVTGRKDGQIRHFQLLPWGPAAVRFDLRHRLRQRFGKGLRYKVLTSLMGLALAPLIALEKLFSGLQSQWSWAPAAYAKARHLLANERFDVIYTTGGAYSAHLAGLWLKRRSGIRWLAEIHDPMVQRYSEQEIPGTPKKTRDERFQAWLEKRICAEANHVWWFTESAWAMARARNPDLGHKGFWVLPGAQPPHSEARHAPGEALRLCHFGSLSATRSARNLLLSIIRLRENQHHALAGLKLEIFGGSLDPAARALKDHPLLAGLVVEHGRLELDPQTGKSGRQQVIDEMHRADILLLLHGEHVGCSEYIPSKLYEYLLAGRPILALVHDNKQLQELVEQHGGYVTSATDPEAIISALTSIHNDWTNNRLGSACIRTGVPTVASCVATILTNTNSSPMPQ